MHLYVYFRKGSPRVTCVSQSIKCCHVSDRVGGFGFRARHACGLNATVVHLGLDWLRWGTLPRFERCRKMLVSVRIKREKCGVFFHDDGCCSSRAQSHECEVSSKVRLPAQTRIGLHECNFLHDHSSVCRVAGYCLERFFVAARSSKLALVLSSLPLHGRKPY